MRVAVIRRSFSITVLMTGALVGLGGCAAFNEFMPPSQQQEFVVTGSIADAPTPFRNSEPGIDTIHAKDICAGGFEKLAENSQRSDMGEINQVTVRCSSQPIVPVPLPIPFP